MSLAKTIKVNMITGFLGTGKTSAIQSLLKQKPAEERWGVLVNEFGEVAMDQVMAESVSEDASLVREIEGGCMCCAGHLSMQAQLKVLINEGHPDRILIEPTGLGHPANILDMLTQPPWDQQIDLRATLCLVNPQHYANPKVFNKEVFRDQIHLADVVLVNKTDLAEKETTEDLLQWARNLFPPKHVVAATQYGEIKDLGWLDIEPFSDKNPLYPDLHQHNHEHTHDTEQQLPVPGQPIRKISGNEEASACGWIFSAEDDFHRQRLLAFFKSLPADWRAKGVFKTGKNRILLNQSDGSLSEQVIAYRKDSRLELIAPDQNIDWQAWEDALMDCLHNPKTIQS